MGKKLAIKGHPTRGKEVIELLEMMGGSNIYKLSGNEWCSYYFIEGFEIELSIEEHIFGDDDICFFTLEEFLEKYPFKVGDFVSIPEYESEVRICNMKWDGFEIQYKVYRVDEKEWYTSDELLDYNDNPNKTIKDMDEKDKAKAPDLKGEDYSGRRFGYKIPDGYEFDTVYNGNIILKPIKPQYPKTYEECCKVLGCKSNHFYTDFSCDGLDVEISEYEDKVDDLLKNFRKLIYCRDAYWKIAGEEMRLGKPWEPDWNNENEFKYSLYYFKNRIIYDYSFINPIILVFPTEEMRDVFCDNFKKEIEQCKELL